ncbi:ECF RNA polymerase sigma factor SigE [Defluviimonas aquaemixtae]|uniref:ECF RNA polymerase sigma factor SigE n=1 Tax=Albidovulum aquaemixtae TaxID=1542388 RepID=A0A2R8B7N0_9RHOB|nr:RNA polymerase sigma factor [Defluviimonas aquaemixtae]SPH18614.1 ECF RNA polymerase sigma factor SigE [Defluviimonas aquaemixtae]
MRKSERIVEEYLVVSARMGDRRALSHLVELRGPRLVAHAVRLLGDREEARDAVQDAWAEILRALPQLADPCAFPAWATRIVTRRCAKLIRGKVRTRELARDFGAEAEHTTAPEDGRAADGARLRAAIAALPEDHAAAIALFYLEDMSVAEVSVALDIPVGTVKTRLMHSRDRLKDILKGDTDDET